MFGDPGFEFYGKTQENIYFLIVMKLKIGLKDILQL